jgi:GTP-binding protein EngB required for normal cell division
LHFNNETINIIAENHDVTMDELGDLAKKTDDTKAAADRANAAAMSAAVNSATHLAEFRAWVAAGKADKVFLAEKENASADAMKLEPKASQQTVAVAVSSQQPAASS